MPLFSSSPKPAKSSASASGGNVDDQDDMSDGNRNIILSIIKQLRPGCDLSRITLPTFILERKSMLERITNAMQHPEMLMTAAQTEDPVDRFVEVVRWYMSSWHIAPKAVKKPLNPVLGEYFSCWWDLNKEGTRAYYISEQTSHHPPKSAYFYTIPDYGVRADGVLLPHSKFLGNSAASMMEGIGFVTFSKGPGAGDEYEISQPNIYARGILTGNLKMEIGDKAYVYCPKLGLRADIDFKVKGFISGTYNAISGTISRNGKTLFEISGKWSDKMNITAVNTHKEAVLFDTRRDHVSIPQTRPLAEQGELESQKLWHNVLLALGKRNHEEATEYKFQVEDHQRVIAKQRAEGKEPPFHPKLFSPVAKPLEWRVCCDSALRHASSQQEVEDVLQSVMPILPGATFPSDFEDSGASKSNRTTDFKSSRGSSQKSNGKQQGSPTDDEYEDEDGDIFLDANEG